MAQRKGISTGTTAQRTIEEQGKLRFNTTTNLLEYYDGTGWKGIDAPPVVSSISPSNLLSGDGTGNYTIVVTGSGFSSNVTAKIITEGGVEISPDTTTRDSSTQVTLVVAKNTANLTNANEPFDVKIVNSSGLAGTLADALTIDASPVFSTAAGSLGTITESDRASTTLTVVAADPESGGDVTYSLESGSLPAGATLTSTSSGGVITGFNAVGTNTTSNFTIRAKDVNSNISDRAFSITVNAPVIQSFTSSGTFSVPSGVTAVNVLVVAGGGSGASAHSGSGVGGGGAGGLIYRPGFPVTPGGTVSVTVGCGGNPIGPSPGDSQGNTGQDSVFGTLTAKGGGGGSHGAGNAGINGGSGGGGGYDSPVNAGDSIQGTQPGDSGNYGFGTSGGQGGGGGGAGGGGGGGAGQPGGAGSAGPDGAGGQGGTGKAYTIADGTTSVYYAGGGGGSAGGSGPSGTFGQGGGSPGDRGGNSSPGTANRGGGSGGTRSAYTTGAGGKGIVIVSY